MNEPQTELTELPIAPDPAPKRRKTWWIIGGITLLVLVAAAAFIGGRLLSGSSDPLAPGLSLIGPGGGQGMVSMAIDIEPAEELPKTPPDANGLFVKREDNLVTIGTGEGNAVITSGGVSAGATAGEPVLSSSSYSGPEVEIVVNQNTKLYTDATFESQKPGFTEGTAPKEGEKIKQILKPGSLDEIGSESHLTVWGRKSGDRIIADIILYSKPVMFFRSSP